MGASVDGRENAKKESDEAQKKLCSLGSMVILYVTRRRSRNAWKADQSDDDGNGTPKVGWKKCSGRMEASN